MEQILIGIFCLTLTACAGFNIGYESHVYDYPREVGTTEYVTREGRTAFINWLNQPDAQEACSKYLPGTEASSCMVWKTDRSEIRPGVHCIGFVVPNKSIVEHEFKRCFDPDYNVGIMEVHK